jgi:hypothetical protein
VFHKTDDSVLLDEIYGPAVEVSTLTTHEDLVDSAVA